VFVLRSGKRGGVGVGLREIVVDCVDWPYTVRQITVLKVSSCVN